MRTLHLTSPPMRGADVLALQEALARLGYKPGPRDGIYGAASSGGVRRFQTAHQLRADGIAGPQVWHALETKPKSAPRVQLNHPPGVKALAWLEQRIGMKEAPTDSNRCPISLEFGVIGAWCAMSVSLAFKHGAGIVLGRLGVWGFYPGKGFAYVPALEAWGKASGYFIGRSSCQPGDIALYNWDGGVPDHTGIAASAMSGGVFDAVEGNTSLGNDSNGGEVMRRRRYASQVDGFLRIPPAR